MSRFEMLTAEEAIKLDLVERDKWDNYPTWCMVIENMPDGSKRVVGCDGGEPEDQNLYRDWNWVIGALNDAYEAGKREAKL